MKKKILTLLSEQAMSLEKLKERTDTADISLILEELENDGTIFKNENRAYASTLLGKMVALGPEEGYEDIKKREDLFKFFRTRIPSAFPKGLLSKFRVFNNFEIIGKPDLKERYTAITTKTLSMQPHAEREIYVSAPVVLKPGLWHLLGALKARPKVRAILPEKEHKETNTFLKVAKKLADYKTKRIDEALQYMGLLSIDDKVSLFGFRTIKNNPGWDAVIYTESKECITWVNENFEYMWNYLAEIPD